jgi:hypothetical protein
MTFYHLTYGFLVLLPVASLLLWSDEPRTGVMRARIFWALQVSLMFDVPTLWRWFGPLVATPRIVAWSMVHVDRALAITLFTAVAVLSLKKRALPAASGPKPEHGERTAATLAVPLR